MEKYKKAVTVSYRMKVNMDKQRHKNAKLETKQWSQSFYVNKERL